MTTFQSRQLFELSGEWNIVFEDEIDNTSANTVLTEWPSQHQKKIQVPGIWNLAYPDQEGIGYYRKTFTLHEEFENRFVRLCFDGATYHASVWLNDNFIGSHEGGYIPFSFEVTPYLRSGGENELVVRVIGLSKNKAVGGFTLLEVPTSKQTWYYVYAGLWGDVFLESLPATSIDSVFVTPDLANKKFSVQVSVKNRTSEIVPAILNLRVFQANDKEVATLHDKYKLSPGKFEFTFHFDLESPIPWDLENPHLYQVKLSLENEFDHEQDVVVEKFGMRDFTVRDGEFFLNEDPIFIKATLNQPNYPKTLIVPPTQAMIEKEIRLIKEAGFNMARMHIRPAPPGYLDLADELGLLIYAESSLAWIRENPRLVDHGKRELREMIGRDRNHPSVVVWGILNENRHCNALIQDEMFRYVRSLDPTRVVIDNSGGTMAIDQDFGWIDEAYMLPNRDTKPQAVRDLHLYIGSILPNAVYDWLRNLGKGVNSRALIESGMGFLPLIEEFDHLMANFDGKIFISEMGCGGFTDLDQTLEGFEDQLQLLNACELIKLKQDLNEGFSERKLENVFGSLQNLARSCCRQQVLANRSQIEAIIQNPNISGYGLTQLNDVAWEYQGGILDLWRNPKPSYYDVCQLNKDTVAILHPETFITTPNQTVMIDVSVVHREDRLKDVEITTAIFAGDGHEGMKNFQHVDLISGTNRFGDVQFSPKGKAGSFLIRMSVVLNDLVIAETETEILVVPEYPSNRRAFEFEWIGSIPELPSELPIPGEASGMTMVAAYPRSLSRKYLGELIMSVEDHGAILILGPVNPTDEEILQIFKEKGINLDLKLGIGNWMGCHHWIPQSLINEPLVTNPIADEKFIGILPRYSLEENGGEVLAGSFQNAKGYREPTGMVWYSDIEKVPLGKGTVIFCQYPIFDSLIDHPLAPRILEGILYHSLR